MLAAAGIERTHPYMAANPSSSIQELHLPKDICQRIHAIELHYRAHLTAVVNMPFQRSALDFMQAVNSE